MAIRQGAGEGKKGYSNESVLIGKARIRSPGEESHREERIRNGGELSDKKDRKHRSQAKRSLGSASRFEFKRRRGD